MNTTFFYTLDCSRGFWFIFLSIGAYLSLIYAYIFFGELEVQVEVANI